MKIEICVGTTCHLMGSSMLLEIINDLPEDVKNSINVKYSGCFDLCYGDMKPPIVKIDEKFYDNMAPEKFKEVVLNLLKENGDE
ncbi:Thioredoxin-like [2Fe-2S] ferredoxin [Marinitoga hydrogenitolerans DSM 16785]|uniref:Thioredoxin-like [2Fe-2S] ferredoxin n=1 Tax=Marinitoga hydrogenitolerans (strain DSM 16785 / JCM 12826 / AT1271) TaxID=1122195 RepID=A0A1M4T023_MARH1|nr:(2Fe-2S) ferredoxin domain-containing protein [Marinitoga hydrogenitolerans]SHE37710.1 Thioredoxin-like [2Fe-2S] ferredoxin [Marinitoga hydrogenitolerans DSM 16785]